MKGRILATAFITILLGACVNGQTKISGTMKCEKPDPSYSVEVQDRPGHVMLLQKFACSFPQAPDFTTDKGKDASGVTTGEVTSTHMTYTGSFINNMESGDKAFTSAKGSAIVKDGKPEGDHGTWVYTGGTGKFKGIKGKGTYKGTPNGDGTSTIEFEGDFVLPRQPAPTKK
jgi:hypothetical protein